jgi:hypothetical protein
MELIAGSAYELQLDVRASGNRNGSYFDHGSGVRASGYRNGSHLLKATSFFLLLLFSESVFGS